MPSGGPVYGYNMLAWLLDRPGGALHGDRTSGPTSSTGRSVDVVELVPAVPDLPFERAVLWLDREDGLPRRLEITEHSGATRTLTLSKVRVNRRCPTAPSASRCRPASGWWISERGRRGPAARPSSALGVCACAVARRPGRSAVVGHPPPPLGGRPEHVARHLVAQLLVDDLASRREGAVRHLDAPRRQPLPHLVPHRLIHHETLGADPAPRRRSSSAYAVSTSRNAVSLPSSARVKPCSAVVSVSGSSSTSGTIPPPPASGRPAVGAEGRRVGDRVHRAHHRVERAPPGSTARSACTSGPW